jgi:hypothetical protein
MPHRLWQKTKGIAACDLEDKLVPAKRAEAAAMDHVVTFCQHLLAEQAETPPPARFQRLESSAANLLIRSIELKNESPCQGMAVIRSAPKDGERSGLRQLCRGKRFSTLVDVQSNTDHGAGTLLDEDAADLTLVDQDIVGPFDLRLQAGPFLNRLAHGVGGPGGENYRTAGGRRRKQQNRKQHAHARLAAPSPAMLATAGCLLLRQDHDSIIGAIVRQSSSPAISAIHAVEDQYAATEVFGFEMPFFAWDHMSDNVSVAFSGDSQNRAVLRTAAKRAPV